MKMTASQLITEQITDPFRIVLLLGLFYTMLRTRAVSGVWLPLAAGAVFVAVIIATVMPSQLAAPVWQRIAAGLVANAMILAVLLALWQGFLRLRR